MRRSVLGAALLIGLAILGLAGVMMSRLLSSEKGGRSGGSIGRERPMEGTSDPRSKPRRRPPTARPGAPVPQPTRDDQDDGDDPSPNRPGRGATATDDRSARALDDDPALLPGMPGISGAGADPAAAPLPGSTARAPSDPARLPIGFEAGPACSPGMVDVGSFCIDANEVTNTAYAAFLDKKPDRKRQPETCSWNTEFTPAYGAPPLDTRPVVGVDWCDARMYCTSVGKRLCGGMGGGPSGVGLFAESSRNEWFYVCTNGGQTKFSYGDTFDESKCAGDEGDAVMAPVGSMATCIGTKAPFDAIFDMSGNAWEWEDSCAGAAGSADLCRVRGGVTSGASAIVSCSMDYLAKREAHFKSVGIRCCADRAAQ